MRRSRQVFLMTAMLVLCAGVVVGRLSARLAIETPSAPQGHPPSWLADQLSLSAEQRQQMDAVWADAKQQMRSDWNERQNLDHQRDEAIRDLLSDDQQLVYQEIHDTYRAKRQEMDRARDVLIKSAEERSRALLSDSQKARWDQLTKDMHGHHPPGPGFGPTSQWSDDHGPPDHDHGPMDHGPMDHGPMDHGPMDHGPPDGAQDIDTHHHLPDTTQPF